MNVYLSVSLCVCVCVGYFTHALKRFFSALSFCFRFFISSTLLRVFFFLAILCCLLLLDFVLHRACHVLPLFPSLFSPFPCLFACSLSCSAKVLFKAHIATHIPRQAPAAGLCAPLPPCFCKKSNIFVSPRKQNGVARLKERQTE